MLHEMAVLTGGAPDEWPKCIASALDRDLVLTKGAHGPLSGSSTDSGTEYTAEAADALWSNSAERFRRSGESQQDALGLVKLLRRMLVIDPAGRPTASELLHDAYLGTRQKR